MQEPYQLDRRNFLWTTTLPLTVPVASFGLGMVQGITPKYDVKIEIEDEHDRRFDSVAGIEVNVKYHPQTYDLKQKTAQEIDSLYQKLVSANKAPDIKRPESFLDDIVSRMVKDPNFIANGNPSITPSQIGGLVNVSYSSLHAESSPKDYLFDVAFAVAIENGKIKPIAIGRYLLQLPEPGLSVDNGLPYEISGDIGDDCLYRGDEIPAILCLKPLNDNDTLAIPRLDFFGHRAKLMKGLANQDITFR